MSKQDDIEDLLGDDAPKTKPAKKAPAKAAEAKPAAKKAAIKVEAEPKVAAKKAAVKAEPAEPKEKVAKEPVSFAEGERDELYEKIKRTVKKDINSRDLAAKLELDSRKLRTVLYSMVKRGEIALTPGESKVSGMTVSPVAA